MIKRFKVGDKVIIISGEEKNKIGIIKSLNNKNNRVIIEGLNMQSCFSKKKKQNGKMKEMSIHISNISHIDPVNKNPTRTRVVVENNSKMLVSAKSGEIIREIVNKIKKKSGRV